MDVQKQDYQLELTYSNYVRTQGCNPEELPEAMNDRERVRDIRAGGATWWWWWLPPITKTIKIRRTRHAGHCWRSRDELVSDVLLWTPSHGRVKAGRPVWTYIQQLCADTECIPWDLPKAMDDMEVWRERVRNIRVDCVTWWWWYNRNKWKSGQIKHLQRV